MKELWQAYLLELKAYEKAVKKYVKILPDGDVSTQDDEGSLPPPPKPPVPPNH